MTLLNTISEILADGVRILEKDQYSQRVYICRFCPHASLSSKRLVCSLCGCDMSIKARFKASGCPEDRWPNLQTQ
jgi:hypothetical protein